jgi:hypothetical protein
MNKRVNFTTVIGQKALISRKKVKNARKQIRIIRGIKINCKPFAMNSGQPLLISLNITTNSKKLVMDVPEFQQMN